MKHTHLHKHKAFSYQCQEEKENKTSLTLSVRETLIPSPTPSLMLTCFTKTFEHKCLLRSDLDDILFWTSSTQTLR